MERELLHPGIVQYKGQCQVIITSINGGEKGYYYWAYGKIQNVEVLTFFSGYPNTTQKISNMLRHSSTTRDENDGQN